MTVEERIEAMLIRYLLDEKEIVAVAAYFGDTNGPYDDGCDTCGWGSTDQNFEIYYCTAGMKRTTYIEIPGNPLEFFPTLLKYDVV